MAKLAGCLYATATRIYGKWLKDGESMSRQQVAGHPWLLKKCGGLQTL